MNGPTRCAPPGRVWIAAALALSACAADATQRPCDPLMPAGQAGAIELEYVGALEDGNRIVVTRPAEDWDYEDFALYFGPPDGLIERTVLEVLRARDGGSTMITFVLDGDQVLADFPIVSSEVDGEIVFESGPAALRRGSNSQQITLEPRAPGRLDGLVFLCSEG